MTESQCGSLARRWFADMWGQRREELIFDLMAPNCTGQTEAGPIVGPEQWRDQIYRPFLNALPDLSIEIVGVVEGNDEAVVRWEATGIHQGDGFGIPGSGLKVRFRGMTWLRFANGQIVEGADSWNQSGVMATLGAPATPSAEVLAS